MNLSNILRSLTIFCIVIFLSAFTWPEEKKINWITIEKAAELNKKHPRKIIVDVYTDWCGWCKRMDKATYENPEVVDLINKNFYAVKFNAEQKEPVIFNEKVYEYRSEYRAHELALSLLSNKMAYPSTAYLDEKYGMLTMVQGYIAPDQMIPILNYFGEKIYKKKSWEEYQKEIKKEIKKETKK